jgi:hypothetical protein
MHSRQSQLLILSGRRNQNHSTHLAELSQWWNVKPFVFPSSEQGPPIGNQLRSPRCITHRAELAKIATCELMICAAPRTEAMAEGRQLPA